MTKRIRSIVAVLAAATLFAACGDGSGEPRAGDGSVPPTTGASPSDDAVAAAATAPVSTAAVERADTLVVWADEPRVQPLRAISAEFAETTGVEVRVEVVPIATMRERIERDIPAGDGPDVFVGPHDWSGDLAGLELIAPIDVDELAT